jgi:hypothetical protein
LNRYDIRTQGDAAFIAATLILLALPPLCFLDIDELIAYSFFLFAGLVICRRKGKE